jgi:hypothetical protein
MLQTSARPQTGPNLVPGPAAAPEISCAAPGCKIIVPIELASEGLCVMHLTFQMEQVCARLRCELVQAKTSPERAEEIAGHVVGLSVLLARIASGVSLSDDRKKRVLNTFLTLMILRETLDRVAVGHVTRRRLSMPDLSTIL